MITGLAFMTGGTPVLDAFQARPKSKAQLTLVLSILVGSGMFTGVEYWQIKTRWLTDQRVILDASPRVPTLPASR